MSELAEEMQDGRGRRVQFAVTPGVVAVRVTPHSGHDGRIMLATKAQREEFAQLYVGACFQADALAAPAKGTPPREPWIRACCDHCDNSTGPDGHGYTLDGPHPGPCEECAHEKARRDHDAGTGD